MLIKSLYAPFLLILIIMSITTGMKLEEKYRLRSQVVEMFKHAFGSYMVVNFILVNKIK